MRRVVDAYEDRVIIGEAYLSLQRTVAYYDAGIHLPFNFALIRSPWNARAVHDSIQSYETLLAKDQWPNWVLGNHDRRRIATRVGGAQARVAAMLLLTLRGTPTLYYGDEIAMEDIPILPDLVKDAWEKNISGLGLGRDPDRSPMQWNSEKCAGFTTGTPWLPVAEDFKCFNVAAQSGITDSSLAYTDACSRCAPANPPCMPATMGSSCATCMCSFIAAMPQERVFGRAEFH